MVALPSMHPRAVAHGRFQGIFNVGFRGCSVTLCALKKAAKITIETLSRSLTSGNSIFVLCFEQVPDGGVNPDTTDCSTYGIYSSAAVLTICNSSILLCNMSTMVL